MRYIYTLALAAILSLSIFPNLASATAQNENPKEGIKLYTSGYDKSYPFFPMMIRAFKEPVDISLIINGELVIAKNHYVNEAESYIELDRKYNSKEITEAKFIWTGMFQGKKWNKTCVEKNLPKYVQEGDWSIATHLEFDCVDK